MISKLQRQRGASDMVALRKIIIAIGHLAIAAIALSVLPALAQTSSGGFPAGTSGGGVTQIIAGSNITLSPSNGLGAVTVTGTGGGGSGCVPGGTQYGILYDTGSGGCADITVGTAGRLLLDQGASAAAFATLSGDCSITSLGVLTCATLDNVSPGAIFSLGIGAGLSSSGGNLLVPSAGITNTMLANSSITIAGHSVSLGGTQAIACGDLSNSGTGCSGTLPTAANPTATCSTSAVNGSAATFLRSDAAVPCPTASASTLGLSSPDNVTLKATAGVYASQYPTSGDLMLSAGNGAVPTAYAGTSTCSGSQVVQTLSAAGVATCVTPSGGSGGLVKIATRTASNSTALQFGQGQTEGSLASLGYNTLFIDCNGVVVGTNASYLYLHVWEGSTPTEETANYFWITVGNAVTTGTSGTVSGSATAASNVGIAPILNTVASAATTHPNYFAETINLGTGGGGGSYPVFRGNGLYWYSPGPNYYGMNLYGTYTGDTNPITALSVDLYSGANGTQETGAAALVSGQCTLYGLQD